MSEPLIIAEAKMLCQALEKYANEGWKESETKNVSECVLLSKRIVTIFENVTYADSKKPSNFEASLARIGAPRILEILSELRRAILKAELILKSNISP